MIHLSGAFILFFGFTLVTIGRHVLHTVADGFM